MRSYLALCLLLISNLVGASSEIDVETGSKIWGKVLTSDNKPAEEVTVYLKSAHYNVITTTNENGFFQFSNIPVGQYLLEISFIGNEIIQKEISVGKNVKMQFQFQLKLQNKDLQEVVVEAKQKRLTIGKMQIADKDLPLSTGIITNKIIQDQQAIRLGDLVKNVPGVSMIQSRYGVNESYSARGYAIGMTGGAGGGSIFKNGLPYNIAGMPEAATLESVEIIKGSSAFLYGSSSGGLIINMVNKKPKFETGGSLMMQMGSYELYKPIIDFYGPLSKKVAYRVVGTYENANSFRDQVKTIRKYINPSFLFKISDRTNLVLQQDYLSAQLTPDMGVGALDSGRIMTSNLSRSIYQNVQWSYNNVTQNSSSMHLKHSFNEKLQLTIAGMYQSSDVDAYGVGNLNTANKLGVIARPLSRAHSLEHVYAAQANLEGKFKLMQIENQFVSGLDYTLIQTNSDAFNILNQTGGILKTYDTINLINPLQYKQKTYVPAVFKTATTLAPSKRVGIYFQDLIKINTYLKLFVGGRYSYQSTIQTTIDSAANYTRSAVSIKGTAPTAEYLVFSPKAGLIIQPNNDQSFYLSYANNFTANTGTDVNGNALPASIMNQYELGSKQGFMNGRFVLHTAFYRIVNSHLAQQAQYKADGVTPNTDATVKTLTGETTSDGFEVGANAFVSKQFYFIAGYGYNNIRFTHSTGTKGSNIEGEQLVNAPKHTANLSMFYTFINNGIKGLKIGASGFYTGERFGGYNNLVGQSILGSRLLKLSDFTTIDLSVGYEKTKFGLNCKLSNVFNTMNYLVHDNYSVNPIAPRQIVFSIKYNL